GDQQARRAVHRRLRSAGAPGVYPRREVGDSRHRREEGMMPRRRHAPRGVGSPARRNDPVTTTGTPGRRRCDEPRGRLRPGGSGVIGYLLSRVRTRGIVYRADHPRPSGAPPVPRTTALAALLALASPAAALEPIPDRLVVLTFDDASKSHFTVARPVLLKHKFGATFFVTEGWDFATNKKDYM